MYVRVYYHTGITQVTSHACDNCVETFGFRFSQNYPAQSSYPKYPCDYLQNLLIRLVSKLSTNEDNWRTNVWTDESVISADIVVNYSFLWYESVVATKVGGKTRGRGTTPRTLLLLRSWHRKVVQSPNELAYLEEAKRKLLCFMKNFSPFLVSWQTYVSAW